ncbi:ribonuclease H-like domain-containing protein, partial [Tanacetum coccineum]
MDLCGPMRVASINRKKFHDQVSQDETLKTQLDDFRIEFNKSEFNLATYKRGLASVEEQLIFYKKNEVIFYEQLDVLKRDILYKDSEISMLKSELEKLNRKGVGFVSYNVVLPPHTGLFSPPKFKLSNSGLEEFQQPKFEGYGPKTSKSISKDISNDVRESSTAPLVEELVSDDKLEKKTAFPTVAKIEFVKAKQQEKPVRKPVKYAEMYRHMTRNMSYPSDFKEFDEGYVTFGGGAKGGKITGKGTLKTSKLDFENVYFVKELQFNLFTDRSQVLLKVPRKNNMYSVGMKNIIPKESLTCLVAKATLDESILWHRRLGHVNFKTINKLVKKNLVRGLPTKRFENDQTCVACLKGKQHKASCIRREFSVARTPQQNGVAERRNRTLIEAARTIGRTHALSSMRPFGCHVTILNTLDYLGKFDGKSDEGFFVGYS